MKKFSLLFLFFVLYVFNTNAQMVVFADNYSTGVSFAAFGGSANALSIDNTQFHSGTASLKIPVPATGYTGGALVAATPQNLSAYNAVTFWAKSSVANPLNGVGLGNNATTTVYAVERNGVALTTTWTKYYIPIPVASKLTAETGLFHFAESEAAAYNIWIDDIQYENVSAGVIGTPTASLTTETLGKEIGQTFNAGGTVSIYPVNGVNQEMQTAKAYFTWTSSNPTVATMDAQGTGTTLAAGTTIVTGKLGAVNATGTLTVNVTVAVSPATAAPTPPARTASDVISLFSGAYTDLAATNWFPNWGQTTTFTDVNIAGNPTKKYASLNYEGVEFAAGVNASAMTKLHLDLWTPNVTSFEVYPIVAGQPEQKVTLTPTLSGWNSFDIDLTQYTIPLNNIIQFKFVGTPSGSGTVYLDNIYFYKSGVVVVPPSTPSIAAPTPNRLAAAVISLFSNAYTNVPVDTWSASWDNADLTDLQITGNDTKKYTNLVFSGIEFTTTTINASAMNFYHVDVWTPDATPVKVKLVDFGANGIYDGGGDDKNSIEYTLTPAPAPGTWVGYDIPLTSFTGLDTKAHLAQMLFVGSNSTLYVDNIYLYNSSVLPVGIADFKVVQKNNTAWLQWATSFELNNKGFAIERSADGVNWKQINFINGTNAANGATYTATDNAPAAGINYYRLKQIDNDGKQAYSATVTINFSAMGGVGFSFYPNPAKDRLTVLLQTIAGNTASLQLVDTEGKVVRNILLSSHNSNSDLPVDVSGISRGVYIIILKDGASLKTSKVIVD